MINKVLLAIPFLQITEGTIKSIGVCVCGRGGGVGGVNVRRVLED